MDIHYPLAMFIFYLCKNLRGMNDKSFSISNGKSFSISNFKTFSHLGKYIFCHFKFCHDRKIDLSLINWVIVTGQLHASTFCNSTINFRNCHFISGTFFAKYKLLSLLVRWSQNCHKLNKKAINFDYEKRTICSNHKIVIVL